MKRLLMLLVTFIVSSYFTGTAYASQYIGYWGSDKGTTMWAESGNQKPNYYLSSIELEGRGTGYIETVSANGSVGERIPVSLDGKGTKVYKFSSNGANLVASSGKLWCVYVNSNSPLGFGICSRPDDYKDYLVEDPVDPTDPGEGGGTQPCLCCQEVADMLGQLKQSMDNSGIQLGGLQGVMDQMQQAVQQQGYQLEQMNAVLHDVSDKLDTANDHLSNISDQVTPTDSYEIDVPDWDRLMDRKDVPYLNDIEPVRDNNEYFTDPGEGDPVPAMPEQPDENFPVPIGKSLQREQPIVSQPPLSPALPNTSSPVGQASPVLTPQLPMQVTPMQAEPVRKRDDLKADPIRQIDKINADPVRQKDQAKSKDQVKTPDPVRQQNQMQADPVRERDPIKGDGVRERTHLYERQEVPKK